MDIKTDNLVVANIYEEDFLLSDVNIVYSVVVRLDDFEEGFLDDTVKGLKTITLKSTNSVTVSSNDYEELGKLLRIQEIKNQPLDSVFLGRECKVYFKKHEMKNPIGCLTHILSLEKIHVEV